MSFASKRVSREARQPKSYVHPKKEEKTDVLRSTSDSLIKEDITLGLYANLPNVVEIRRDEQRGRGIWCRQAIKQGSIILTQRPHVAVLATPNLHVHCSYCMKLSGDDKLKRCTKCRTVWYCSATCQNNDWKLHKYECPAITDWVSSATEVLPPAEAIRSLGRILWGRKVHGASSVWWREINALQSHRASIPASAMESYTQLAFSLVRYIKATSQSELETYGIRTPGELVDLISRFSTNTFTLTSPTLSPLGSCVSPIAALFNHSCIPNAVMVFPHQQAATSASDPSPLLHVIAIKDISAGEEILTSYIDTSLTKALRQQSLKESYSFECICPLCTNAISEIDPREALWCPKSCGGMCPFLKSEGSQGSAPQCGRCKSDFNAAELGDICDKVHIGQEALEKANSLQFSDPDKALSLTSHILPLLNQFPPSTHPVLALLRLHQTLLISALSTTTIPDVLNDAIRTSSRVVSGLMSIFDEGHPVRGICLAELGKLLAVDEPPPSDPSVSSATTGRSDVFPPSGPARLALALETLKRALKELMIGFGEKTGGGDVGRDVRGTVLRLETEMNMYARGVRNTLETAHKSSS